MILKSFKTFIQLKTFDDIFFMTFDQSKNRYTKNKIKKSIFSLLFLNLKFSFIFHSIVSLIKLINSMNSIINKNVIQRRKKKNSKIDFDQLIETDQISLNVIKNKFKKKCFLQI